MAGGERDDCLIRRSAASAAFRTCERVAEDRYVFDACGIGHFSMKLEIFPDKPESPERSNQEDKLLVDGSFRSFRGVESRSNPLRSTGNRVVNRWTP